MPPSASPGPAAPARPVPGRWGRRSAWVAWRIGWFLLAAVSMVVAYGALVIVGR